MFLYDGLANGHYQSGMIKCVLIRKYIIIGDCHRIENGVGSHNV